METKLLIKVFGHLGVIKTHYIDVPGYYNASNYALAKSGELKDVEQGTISDIYFNPVAKEYHQATVIKHQHWSEDNAKR